MKTWAIARVAIGTTLFLMPAGFADTVFLKNGDQLDGKVKEVNANTIALHVGKGRILFQASEIDHFEENDKEGAPEVLYRPPLAVRHEESMKEQTGLTREQRDEVRALMEPLASPDPNERAAAREQLVAKAREADITKFLGNAVGFLSSRQATEIMQVLCDIDNQAAKPVLEEATTSPLPPNRAKALQLLATVKEEDPAKQSEALDMVARGLVDPAPDVQAAAALSLAEMGDKRATSVLVEGLKNEDKRVQNACVAALQKLWGTEEGNMDSPEERRTFWEGKATTVEKSIDPKSLTPLHDPEVHGAAPCFQH